MPLTDSQEFSQILDTAADIDNYRGEWNPSSTYLPGDVVKYNGLYYTVTVESTNIPPPNTNYYSPADSLRDIVSTYNLEMSITKSILDQAEADAPRSGYDTTAFYTLQVDSEGRTELVTADSSTINASTFRVDSLDSTSPAIVDASTIFQTPSKDGYLGYLIQDGEAPNGAPFSSGVAFPNGAIEGQFCLRTDFMPNRLFRFNGAHWMKYEDNVRMTMNNIGIDDSALSLGPIRQTQKGTFINNTNQNRIDGRMVDERQSLSKALRPKAD